MSGRIIDSTSVHAFGRALAAEWRKLWAVRATAATVISLPFVALLFAWLFSNGGGREYAGSSLAEQAAFDPTAISLQSHLMAQMVVGILGVLAITTEYSTGQISTTTIAVPRRGALFAAKATVITTVTLITGTLTALLSYWLGQTILGSYGAPTSQPFEPGVVRAIAGMGLYLALTALLGLALGILFRSSAAALGTIVTAVLILPALSQNLPESIAEVIARFWPNLAGARIMSTVTDPGLLTPVVGFALFLFTVAAVTVAAYVTFRNRDV